MIKTAKNRIVKSALTLAMTLSIPFCTTVNAFANNISLETMTKDITFLASDELNGRANFTNDIDKAAHYISQRFKEIGLVPMKGEQSFLQSFDIINIAPKSLSATLNGQTITDKNIAMASTIEQFNWTSQQDFSTHVIGKEDNMRAVIGSLNQTGGKHLVLINTAHAKLFAGYRGFFARGLNKLQLEHQGAIVMVLTDENNIGSVDVTATTTITKLKLTNVVGLLPGVKSPKEIVLFSGHYDHLGVAPARVGSEKTDVIYNGADDDASGITAVINLAQFYAKKGDNARSLMFSAFTAEEIGGFGSRYFSQQLSPDDVVAMINIEMIGKPSKFGAGEMWMTGMERSNLGALLNESLTEKGGKVHQDPYPEQQLFYRSDNATLARLGVPAHSFSSTQLDKDKHYHQVSDDLASLDLTSMHQVIESLAIASQGIVDGDITPTRVDVSLVKKRGKIY
jgi:aminopeptidase YwaD